MTLLEKYVPVSVIIPYNIDRGYLSDAIRSAENQTVSCEVIPWQGDYWLSKNINDAIRTSTGDYIKILAEDDLLTANCIEDLYNGIQGYDWICADAVDFEYIDDGKIIDFHEGHLPKFEEVRIANCIHGGSTLYRKDMIYEIGGWDESLYTGEEYDLHLKLLASGYKVGYINKTVYKYRLHDRNKSVSVTSRSRIFRRDYMRKIRQRYA
jgi:GT2 family glycosyltransferase